VKKLAIVLLFVAAACRRQATAGSPPVASAGAATPRDAVVGFMAAAKVQDLQAMALLWGTTNGPALSTMDKESRDQREIIMMCYLKHDTYRVLSEAPSTNTERVLAVEVTYKGLTRSTNFYATGGPAGRWFVRTFDLEPLRDLCATK
jgi:hypothetical protein